MNMPVVPEEIFIEGMNKLIALDKNWIPAKKTIPFMSGR